MTNPNSPTEINPAVVPAIEINEPSEAKPATTVETPEIVPAHEAAPDEALAAPVVNGVDPTAP